MPSAGSTVAGVSGAVDGGAEGEQQRTLLQATRAEGGETRSGRQATLSAFQLEEIARRFLSPHPLLDLGGRRTHVMFCPAHAGCLAQGQFHRLHRNTY